eukprot:7602853-Pyramimonas_sp.AAC.1
MGDEACKGCAEMGRGRMRAQPLGPPVALHMSHETLYWERGRHASVATGAVDGAPYGATKR